MVSSPDSRNTVDRRQRPFTIQTGAAACARTSPRPIVPQPDAPGSASVWDEPSTSSEHPRPTLPRVVVPTFPECNRPQGHIKRNADATPPSPRHRMTKRQRNAITAKEKLHWLKMQDSQPDLSNRALAKLARVQLCQIHEWKKLRERLEVASNNRRRLMGHGRNSKYPFMERAVYRQVLKHRAEGLAVTGEVEVLDNVNDLVDNDLVVNPFYAEVPMLAEELQAAAQEDDAAEEDAEAAAAEEEGFMLEECRQAEEPSNDEWWRPGRYDGEECEEW
ncbi:unnamed protein product [Closterium sp. NIES-64]|nr:unnamed protein product [Closterium sp. NIES-64]